MGLGLAVVQRYVEAHGGWVKLSSAQGRGSTFTLFLPRQEARAPIREHRQGASTGGRRPAGTVLPQAVPAGPGTATDSEEGSGLAPASSPPQRRRSRERLRRSSSDPDRRRR